MTNQFNKLRSKEINYQQEFDILKQVKILDGELNNCSFAYKYIYYYYVAKYFSNNIHEQIIQEHIINISQKIYNEEYANIMIFLCHLSKNPFITQQFLNNAKEIYKDTPPYDLDHHFDFIKNMNKRISSIPLPKSTIAENEEIALKRADEYDSFDEKYEDCNSKDLETKNESLMQLNKSLKTIQILGQIIKNYPGSLTGSIYYDIVQECHQLGLRTLNYIFELTDANIEPLTESLAELYVKNNNKNIVDDEIRNYTRNFIQQLLELLSLGMIARISDSIASKELKLTYKEIMENNRNSTYTPEFRC